MHIMITGGTGFIGRALTHSLLQKNINVTIVGRSADKIRRTFNNQVRILTWSQLEQPEAVQYVKDVEVIINLAGSNISSQRWTAEHKKEIIDSRIKPTVILTNLLVQIPDKPPALFNANGTGIYGLQPNQMHALAPAFDEQSTIACVAASDFLAEVGFLWEQATALAENAGIRVVKMRFAPVLSSEGGILTKILPAYRLGLGGKLGNGTQAFSWISLHDLIRAIHFLIEHQTISGPVNIISPETVQQKEFAHTLAQILHRPCVLTLPSFAIKLIFGQMGEQLLLQGQHVVPHVLLDNGFTFDYPYLKNALDNILLGRS